MTNAINLYDFDLLNQIIENNEQIRNMSTILSQRMLQLVDYLHNIAKFPKKSVLYATTILKVYSNILENSDNSKVNDLIIDIILKEESFFQIQSLLLGKSKRETYQQNMEHFQIISKFLKGISAILKNQNIKIVKKKFYQIFNRMEEINKYFNCINDLLINTIKKVKDKINKEAKLVDKEDFMFEQSEEQPEVQNLDDDQNDEQEKYEEIQEALVDVFKQYLMIQSYYIHIFYKLFFDVKGNTKQVAEKLDIMKMFISSRRQDVDAIKMHLQDIDIEEWEEYVEFDISIQQCRKLCQKHILSSVVGDIPTRYHSEIITPKSQRSKTMREDDDIHNFGDLLSLQSKNKNRNKSRSRSIRLSVVNQYDLIAQKKEKAFQAFKWNILHDDQVRAILKKEMNDFSQVLLDKFKLADLHSNDISNQKYFHFFEKLIDYTHQLNAKETFEDTKLLVEVLSHFIDLTNQSQSYKGEGFEAKTQLQEKLNKVGAVNMVLQLMCSEQNEVIDDLFPQLLCLANRILDGADEEIQDIFTEYLSKNESSSNMFERFYHLIEKDIHILKTVTLKNNTEFETSQRKVLSSMYQKQKSYNGSASNTDGTQSKAKFKVYSKSINVQKQILKFLKNLCENHNTCMQLLIGNQQNFGNQSTYDMVSLTANYLNALIPNLHSSKRNYSNASQCCVALAEYVQGPCLINQSLIKDANFYQIAVQILQITPNLMKEKVQENKNLLSQSSNNRLLSQTTPRSNAYNNQLRNNAQSAQKQLYQNKKISNVGMFPIINTIEDTPIEQNDNISEQKNNFHLSNFMIQKLKLNCTIILLSLLEQRAADDPLLLSMKRSIPLETIKQNILYEYFLFSKDYNKFLSRENFFRHVLTESDENVQEELIIEVGFNLYFLLKRWSEDKKTNDSSLDELMEILTEKGNQLSGLVGIFKHIGEFVQYMKDNIQHLRTQYKKRNRKMDERHKSHSIKQFISKPSNLEEALLFFKHNSGHIDVLIKGSIEQVYFPYMPYCTYLTDEEKSDFYNNLPTDRDKEKIDALITDSTDLIRRMKIEYHFKKFFINQPLIGAFMHYTELWKTFSFYIIIILNIMNICSYTAENGNDRMNNPILFHTFSSSTTMSIYQFLGMLQLIFALFIDITIISKGVIYHYQLLFEMNQEDQKQQELLQQSQHDGNNNQENQQNDNLLGISFSLSSLLRNEKVIFTKRIAQYALSSISDMNLLYYVGYLIFSFCGYFIHPFFYCYHLIDLIIGNPYLKNILKAVYRPRYELMNTLLLYVCLQYIFTIFAYMNLYSDFERQSCSSLMQCFLIIFDQTFKNDGGVGNFLNKPYPEDMMTGEHVNYYRFFFDNMFTMILVILVIEIISGIIIDTFGALREEHNKITDSIENQCMICGKNRDFIEREHQDECNDEVTNGGKQIINEKAFELHKEEQHNIYEYIYFLAYLAEKPELEYTGLESFVSEKYQEHNNTWFPIYKVGGEKGRSSQQIVDSNLESNTEESGDEEDDQAAEDKSPSKDKALKKSSKHTSVNNKEIMEILNQMSIKIDALSNKTGIQDIAECSVDARTEKKTARSIIGSSRQTINKASQMSLGLFNKTASPRNTIASKNQQKSSQHAPMNIFQKHKNELMAVGAFTTKLHK